MVLLQQNWYIIALSNPQAPRLAANFLLSFGVVLWLERFAALCGSQSGINYSPGITSRKEAGSDLVYVYSAVQMKIVLNKFFFSALYGRVYSLFYAISIILLLASSLKVFVSF